MAFYYTPMTSRSYESGSNNFVIVWSKPLEYCRVAFKKFNAETQMLENYYGWEEGEGEWDSSSSTVTELLDGWPNGYYILYWLKARYIDGSDVYYYSEIFDASYGVSFVIGEEGEDDPPPKASDPTPSNGAVDVSKDITTFTWSVS